jgi:chitin synthase
MNGSIQALPLVANASPFQRADLYDDDYENKSLRNSEEYDGRSWFTSNHGDSMSNFGSKSYAPTRNMFQNCDKPGLVGKEALEGEL